MLKYYIERSDGYWLLDPEIPIEWSCWTRTQARAWKTIPTCRLDKPQLVVFLNREVDMKVRITQHEP